MREMPDDWPIFLVSIGIMVLYLIGSAATEMGTKWPQPNWPDRWPWKK